MTYRIGQTKTLAEHLAVKIDARSKCLDGLRDDWRIRHEQAIRAAVNCLPHGSGIDGQLNIDLDRSTGERIVILGVDYHHMDEYGGYDGWTNHTITATPSLIFGLNLKITGRDRNETKDYLHEIFFTALRGQWTEVHDTEEDTIGYWSPEMAKGLAAA